MLFFLIAGAVSIPLMNDYVVAGSNISASLSRIEALKNGMGKAFPVRVMPLSSSEFGYGAAGFQADLFLLIPALLRLVGIGVGTAYKIFLFLINLATAGISYTCFCKAFDNKNVGWLGSVLYTWCPYRCSDMYINANIGEAAAWTFLPIVLLGLTQLYRKCADGEKNTGWLTLSVGYSLLILSSMTFFFIAMAASILAALWMGKRSLSREVILNIGKTILFTALWNAWFLIPALQQMTDVNYLSALLYEDFRERGMYLLQYFNVFPRPGASLNIVQSGVPGTQAMGAGIGTILLVAGYLYCLFVNKIKDRNGLKICGLVATLMLLSSNLFPWDLLQNKNMIFSMLLVLIQSPAKWGVAANCGLIWIACRFLRKLIEKENESREQTEHIGKWIQVTAVAFAFGAIQFLMGGILYQRGFVRPNEPGTWGEIPMSVYLQETALWRGMEVVSAVALCACVAFWIWKKRCTGSGK